MKTLLATLAILISLTAQAAPPPPPGFERFTPNRVGFDIKLHRHSWKFGVHVKF